jgi:hypothetical protein
VRAQCTSCPPVNGSEGVVGQGEGFCEDFCEGFRTGMTGIFLPCIRRSNTFHYLEKKRERLLQKAHELYLLKREIDPKYRNKIFPSWRRIKSKRTNNLETWITTTAQSVHYLLNVNNQADDDPPLELEVPPSPVPTIPDPARFEAPAHTIR